MSKKYRFIPFVALLSASLLLVGCDGDPDDDADIEDVMEFDIGDYTEDTSGDDLAGVWVAVGAGTFNRDDSGDVKFGDQSSKIYFVIKGSAGSYKYANCFDTGMLEGGYDRGDYEDLTVSNSSISFDSVIEADGEDDELLSEEDDYTIAGTVNSNSSISAEFVFDDGDSREVNTFEMIKVNVEDNATIGISTFENSTETLTPTVSCFAQWSGSYSTSDGFYTVTRYDASFDTATYPLTASEYFSDEDDIDEYSSIVYGTNSSSSFSTKDDDFIDMVFFLDTFLSQAKSNGSSIDNLVKIDINHASL